MAETRKFNPGEGLGLQKLVREALGETVRPTTPGEDVPAAADVEPGAQKAEEPDVVKMPESPLAFGEGGGGAW